MRSFRQKVPQGCETEWEDIIFYRSQNWPKNQSIHSKGYVMNQLSSVCNWSKRRVRERATLELWACVSSARVWSECLQWSPSGTECSGTFPLGHCCPPAHPLYLHHLRSCRVKTKAITKGARSIEERKKYKRGITGAVWRWFVSVEALIIN